MRGLNELVKASLPRPARRIARFLYRLPVHFRSDVSYQLCAEEGRGHGTIFIADGIRMQLPDHAIANSVFRSMAFESRSQQELKSFLRLAQGCTRLCDVGASGGFFSALFARSRATSSILAIEFDRPSLAVLAQTRERNLVPGSTWLIDERGISDTAETVCVASSGYGGVAATSETEVARSEGFALMNQAEAEKYSAKVDRLHTICADHKFMPDLIKVDIEGFEYEMIMSSLEFLGDLKPRMSFELHVAKLKERGKNAQALLEKLSSLGYKLAWSGRPLTDMLADVDTDGTARAAIIAS